MSVGLDLAAVEAWIRSTVGPIGPLELAKERPWATVLRTDVAGEPIWFKACRPVQAFEPRLSAELFARWPERVARVLAHDAERAWLLTADAGVAVEALGNPPEIWLRTLPIYAELQRGESEHAASHLAHGVPDLRLATLPARFEELVASDLPLDGEEVLRLRRFGRPFATLCEELTAAGPAESIQHDDLHVRSVFVRNDQVRILDWGDASIAHPFFSLVVTFRFLQEHNGLAPDDPWFDRLRDAYLEPWGAGFEATFTLAQRVGMVAHALAWQRHRQAMAAAPWPEFEGLYAALLRRVLATAVDESPASRG